MTSINELSSFLHVISYWRVLSANVAVYVKSHVTAEIAGLHPLCVYTVLTVDGLIGVDHVYVGILDCE